MLRTQTLHIIVCTLPITNDVALIDSDDVNAETGEYFDVTGKLRLFRVVSIIHLQSMVHHIANVEQWLTFSLDTSHYSGGYMDVSNLNNDIYDMIYGKSNKIFFQKLYSLFRYYQYFTSLQSTHP